MVPEIYRSVYVGIGPNSGVANVSGTESGAGTVGGEEEKLQASTNVKRQKNARVCFMSQFSISKYYLCKIPIHCDVIYAIIHTGFVGILFSSKILVK
jgi:hypothetical protein